MGTSNASGVLDMSRFRKVCKMTRRPLRWTAIPSENFYHVDIITERCLHGECATCNATYRGISKYDIWANDCRTVPLEDLLDYGKYEVPA